MFCKLLEQVIEFFGAAITKKPHFWPKNGQKKPFLAQDSVFGALVVSCRAPHPILRVLDSKQKCFARFWSKLLIVLEPPSPKSRIFCPKMAKSAIFLPKTVLFGPEWAFVGPPALF